VIDVKAKYGATIGAPNSAIAMFHLGGAMARVADDATAFNGRASGHTINVTGNTAEPGQYEAERDWVRGCWDELQPYNVGAYVNFLMDEGEQRVRRSYGAEKYARLQQLKRKYDPQNVFRLNQNIPPA